MLLLMSLLKFVTAQGVGMPAWGVAHSQGTQDFDSKAKKKRRKEAKERASARGLNTDGVLACALQTGLCLQQTTQ